MADLVTILTSLVDPERAAIRKNIGGKSILNGTGAPSAGSGIEGDFYLDTATLDLYGPKDSEGWGDPVTLIGPTGEVGPEGPVGDQGPAGNMLRYGAGAPSNDLGNDDDWYIDTVTYDLYGPKATGVWGAAFPLKGADGGTIAVEYNDVEIAASVSRVNFTGSSIAGVTDDGGGQVTVQIESSGAILQLADFTSAADTGGVVEQNTKGVYLEQPSTDATSRWARLIAPAPAGDFDIVTCIDAIIHGNNYPSYGITMQNIGSGRTFGIDIVAAATLVIETANWSNLTTFSGTVGTSKNSYIPVRFLRLQKTGTTLNSYWSVDGENWVLHATQPLGSWVNSIDQVFVHVKCSGAGNRVAALVRKFSFNLADTITA